MLRCLVLALVVAAAVGQQHNAPCKCGAYITTPNGEILLQELPAMEVNTCDQHLVCKDKCYTEFQQATGDGDLDHIIPGGLTVGQSYCDMLGHPILHAYIYAYAQLCEGPLEYTGDVTNQPLCCDTQGNYQHC